MTMDERVSIDFIRNLLKEGKPLTEIMKDVMGIGAKLAEEYGHKDYDSIDAFFADLKAGTSPLSKIDGEIVTDVEGAGENLVCVKQCPFKGIMKEMSESGSTDAKVNTVMDGHQLREGEESGHIDVGCYIAQQLRQMVISSLKINGKYDLNYIHLGCDKGTGKRSLSKGDIEAINMDENLLNRLLDEYDCVYAISYKEGQE